MPTLEIEKYAPPKKKLTYQDFVEQTPEGWGYELIDGEIIHKMTGPNIKHQIISGNLELELRLFVRKNRLGQVFDAPTDVKITETNTVEPDIFFISNDQLSIIKENRIEGVPDIVIEILSPSTGYYDLRTKYDIYENAGVKEYWIVDPELKTFEIYSNQDKTFVLIQKLKEKGLVKSAIFSELELDIQVLW